MRLTAVVSLAIAHLVTLVACAQAPTGAPVAPVSAELTTLTSSYNQLTYPPYLRSEPAPAPDQGYDARTAELLGIEHRTSMPSTMRTRIRRDAEAFGPITGRWLMLPLGADLRSWTTALAPVKALRRADGSYAEAGMTTRAAMAEATEHVVELARSTGDTGFLHILRGRTSEWLTSAARSHMLAVAAPAAEALKLLGRGAPAATRFVAPDASDFPRSSDEQRGRLLTDTYNYVRWAQAAGQRVAIDTDVWLHVFDANVSTLSDAEAKYQLTAILRGTGVPRGRLRAVAEQLVANRLPEGLYRDPSSYAGDPSSTVYGLALRHQAGESMADAMLASGVTRAIREQRGHADPLSAFVLRSLAALTNGRDATSVAGRVCDRQERLGRDDVPRWAFEALVCRLDGVTSVAPLFSRWRTNDAHGLVEAAWAVVTLSDAGHLDDAPVWVLHAIPDEPDVSLMDPERLGGLRNAAVVISAIRDVYGRVSPATFEAVAARASAARGCPGYPDLYRAVPAEPFSCDLATTFTVRRYLDPAISERGSHE